MAMWLVRAGRNAQILDDFLDRGVVAIGWSKLGDLRSYQNKESLSEAVQHGWPNKGPGYKAIVTGQLYRFVHEIAKGDQILTYDPQQRVYHVGRVDGDYEYNPEAIEDAPNIRRVIWERQVERDALSTGAKNSLGAISTLFRVPSAVAQEIKAILAGNSQHAPDDTATEAEEWLLDTVEAKALEFIKDKVSQLDWEQMQELVAGVLRAMGYKTRVSAAGPDKGKDIVASPDGFGFESPRIVVEVKHRRAAMGAQDVRSFLGGRHKDDKGLYVSTGGFTKDAYYEAERANIPLTLMSLDQLVHALLEHYEALDLDTKQLVPLKKIYWPM